MIILRTLDELTQIRKPVQLALGVFDGIHLGHKTVIEQVVADAHAHDELAGILTFEDHPMALICPERRPGKLLSTPEHKQRLIQPLGVDVLIILPFTRELATLPAEEFLRILYTRLQLRGITVGTDWCFGRNRTGNVDYLRAEGAKYGFTVQAIPPVTTRDGLRISSTAIREAIAKGKFDRAREMLGREYTLTGTVFHGRHLARQWGVPTANIHVDEEQLPPSGVYLIRATLQDGSQHDGIANLGRRPTVETSRAEKYLEVHLFDFQGDLYGQEVAVRFVQFLRHEQKFSSIDQLKTQIELDVQKAHNLFKMKHSLEKKQQEENKNPR